MRGCSRGSVATLEICKLEEPLRKKVVETLVDLKARLGADFFLSHATHRIGPFGISVLGMEPYFWSEDYYVETMKRTDQTVVMAYDTRFDFEKLYIGLVRHQTLMSSRIAGAFPEHELLIGGERSQRVARCSLRAGGRVRSSSVGRSGVRGLGDVGRGVERLP